MARVGLTKQQYVNFIKLQLGGNIVNVEVEDVIPDIVDMAFIELKNYITDVETMTLPYQSVINLEGKKVFNIMYVMRGQLNYSTSGLQNLMYVYTSKGTLDENIMMDYARALLVNQNKSAMATDMDFHYDKKNEKLYLYAQQVLPSTVTLVYTVDYESVEEIYEPFWQNLLKRLALALTKETLGRVRGKYTLNSATYNLDADQLLSEANAELTDIRTYLNTNSDLLLPID